MVCFLLSDASAYITGTEIRIDGGVPLGNRSMALPADRSHADFRRLSSRQDAQSAGRRVASCRSSKARSTATATSTNETASACWRRSRSSATPRRRVQAASEKSRVRFAKRKQLMPRERIALLLDRGAPFLELMSLAGYRMYDDKDGTGAGGGAIAGIGYVQGVRCMVSASNSAVKGGTISPSGQRKGQRMQQVVLENKLPLVYLVESGGANLMYQAEIFIPGGRGFANQARMSARGIPQVTRRARLLDGGRRLPAGAERLRHHGAQPGQGVPGRPAAPEGRDRRDRDRRGSGRRRDARHRLGRRRMDGRERRRRHPHGARRDRHVALERQAAAARRTGRSRNRSTTSTSCAASCRPRTRIRTTCAR